MIRQNLTISIEQSIDVDGRPVFVNGRVTTTQPENLRMAGERATRRGDHQDPGILRLWGDDVGVGGENQPATGRPDTFGPTLVELAADYAAKAKVAKSTEMETLTELKQVDEFVASEAGSKFQPFNHRSVRPMAVRDLNRDFCREFLHWRGSRAGPKNPGRVYNKARAVLLKLLNFAEEEGYLEAVPRLPKKKPQIDAAGNAALTSGELERLYQAAGEMQDPRRFHAVGGVACCDFWRAALVAFYTYAFDTQLVFPYTSDGRESALRWRNVTRAVLCPDREYQSLGESPHGWIMKRRPKTSERTRSVMVRRITGLMSEHLDFLRRAGDEPDSLVFKGAGGSKPCGRFLTLVEAAGIEQKYNAYTETWRPWGLKDLRKLSGQVHDGLIDGAGAQILAHADNSVTTKNYLGDAAANKLADKSLRRLEYPSRWIF